MRGWMETSHDHTVARRGVLNSLTLIVSVAVGFEGVQTNGAIDEIRRLSDHTRPGSRVFSRKDPFCLVGIRDPDAPNKDLTLWTFSNKPISTQLSEGLRERLEHDIDVMVDLHDVTMTDALREQLRSLRRVKWLSMSAGITASDLKWIGELRQLRGLSLAHADLAGCDFRNVASLDCLQWLNLKYARIRPQDFTTFPRLRGLQVLVLVGPAVTDDFLVHLAGLRLPSLESLTLEHTSATDAGIEKVCSAYDLKALNLFRSRTVTRASIEYILRMKSLEILGIGMTGIAPDGRTNDAVLRLRRSLPDCLVDWMD